MPAYSGDSTEHISAAIGSVPSGSAVSAVAKRLLDYFTSGELAPGTRLPPERALAASLQIGRSAVREALAALEILGVVDVRPGSGTYLRGGASELLPETLSWGLMIGAPRTAELIAVRAQLEVFAAQRAVTGFDEPGLRELGLQVEAMSQNLDNPTRFIEADLKFHLQIARAADNKVLFDLLQSIRALLRVWVERGLQSREEAERALAEHTLLYDALRARDLSAVVAAMTDHMTTASERLNRTIGAAPGAEIPVA